VKKIKTRGKFVIIENFLFEGWVAIEGDENDKLVTHNSYEEAEEELKNTLRDFTESGLEGYNEDSEEFRVMKLDKNLKLRDGLTR
jgi:hypothetical protein